jgi:hypothetical protein
MLTAENMSEQKETHALKRDAYVRCCNVHMMLHDTCLELTVYMSPYSL